MSDIEFIIFDGEGLPEENQALKMPWNVAIGFDKKGKAVFDGNCATYKSLVLALSYLYEYAEQVKQNEETKN